MSAVRSAVAITREEEFEDRDILLTEASISLVLGDQQSPWDYRKELVLWERTGEMFISPVLHSCLEPEEETFRSFVLIPLEISSFGSKKRPSVAPSLPSQTWSLNFIASQESVGLYLSAFWALG